MLVAVAIFALLSGLAFAGLKAIGVGRERVAAWAGWFDDRQSAEDSLRGLLATAIPRGDLGLVRPVAAFRGEAEDLTFASIRPLETGLGVARIRIHRTADDALLVERCPAVGAGAAFVCRGTPEASRLVAGIAGLRFRYFDGIERAWREDWINRPRLPSAIEIDLGLAGDPSAGIAPMIIAPLGQGGGG